MVKVRIIKENPQISLGKKGDVIEVSRNLAHTLIDTGVGELVRVSEPEVYKDRMLSSDKNRMFHKK